MKKLVYAGAAVVLTAGTAMAQTDLTTTISTVSGYWTAAEIIGISILLFVVGRKVVRKI